MSALDRTPVTLTVPAHLLRTARSALVNRARRAKAKAPRYTPAPGRVNLEERAAVELSAVVALIDAVLPPRADDVEVG